MLEAAPEALAALPGFDADTVEAVLAAARTQQAADGGGSADDASAAGADEAAAEPSPETDEPAKEN